MQLLEKINQLKIEFVYVVLMTIIGTALVFITPPIQVPDETVHFFRAWQIAEGTFRSPSHEVDEVNGKKIYFYASVPQSFFSLSDVDASKLNYYSISETFKYFSVPLDKENRADIPNLSSGAYSPLVYAPQAIGAFFGNLIFGTIGAIFYGARLGAVIFVVICGFFALKLLPEKKFLIFAVAFMPMFLSETASCSADSVIYGISILSTAYLLSLMKSTAPISAREIFFLILTAISLGLAKSVYGTILLLYLLIPAERFGGKKIFYLSGIFLLSIFFISSLSWMHFSKNGVDVSPFIAPSQGVDMQEQIEFVKNNPVHFLKAVYETFHIWWKGYINGAIGILGWLSIIMPQWFYHFYYVVLIAAATTGNLNLKISQRALMIFAIIPAIVAMGGYFYVTWSVVGANTFEGFQGRYLIPLEFMFLAAFSFFKNNRYENILILLVCSLSSYMTIFKTIERFYQ